MGKTALILLTLGPAAFAGEPAFRTARQAALSTAVSAMSQNPRVVQRLGKVTPGKLREARFDRAVGKNGETRFFDTRASQGKASPYPGDSFASVAVNVKRTGAGWVGEAHPIVIGIDKWVKQPVK